MVWDKSYGHREFHEEPDERIADHGSFHDCANAVGAAIAKISGQIDVVKVLEGLDEDKVVEEVCSEARKMAIAAGAGPESVRIVTIDNMPLEYVQMRATRLIVRAVSGNSRDPPSCKSMLIGLSTRRERSTKKPCCITRPRGASMNW